MDLTTAVVICFGILMAALVLIAWIGRNQPRPPKTPPGPPTWTQHN